MSETKSTVLLVAGRLVNEGHNANTREGANKHLGLGCDILLLPLEHPSPSGLQNGITNVGEDGGLVTQRWRTTARKTKPNGFAGPRR